jgi:hypothetical protein
MLTCSIIDDGRQAMSADQRVTMTFPSADPAEANELAEALSSALATDVPGTPVERVKADQGTQDFGATIIVIVGSAAATQLAKGVAAWLKARGDARLKLSKTGIDGSEQSVEVDGQVSARAERAIKEFLGESEEG